MTHEYFMLKLAELNAELSKAVILNCFSDIEFYSFKIGKLITKYLGENKLYCLK